MSETLQFKITTAGVNAAINASNTGIDINLTHIQIGTGNKTPTGSETLLLAPAAVAEISAGSKVSVNQIKMSAIFNQSQTISVREIGIWAGEPGTGGAVLFAYWSQSAGTLTTKSPLVDLIFSHSMVIDTAVPAGNVNILIQSTQNIIVNAHESAPDPHPQYLTEPRAETLFTPLSHLSIEDPHPAYLTKALAQILYTPISHINFAQNPDPHEQYYNFERLTESFTGLYDDRGFIELPAWLGGLTIQWGTDTDQNRQNPINFTVSFKSKCFVIVANFKDEKTGGQGDYINVPPVAAKIVSKSQFTLHQGGEASNFQFFWIAIGI